MTLISHSFIKVTSTIFSDFFFSYLISWLLREVGELRGLKESEMAIQFWNYL